MNADILQQAKILVDFLGKTLGPDYEIILQDLTDNNLQITAISNGHISGRSIGSPLTSSELHLLSSNAYEKSDYITNYKGVTGSGHQLRSSAMFIKDNDGTPVALLCINFDDSRYKELAQSLCSIIHPDSFKTDSLIFDTSIPASQDTKRAAGRITENFPMGIPTLMEKIFRDSTTDIQTSADRLTQQERKDVMAKLNEQGLFQLKGAIGFVAQKFACSTATIYRYLSEITN